MVIFYGVDEDTICPAGCGLRETRLHYLCCNVPSMKKAHQKHKEIFHHTHAKLKTAKVIYDALESIIGAIQKNDKTPTLLLHYDSPIDRAVRAAWKSQRTIGWENILKGRISKLWGKVQALYYENNILLHDSKQYLESGWMSETVGSFIDLTLGLWTERYNILHGSDITEFKQKKKEKMVERVRLRYEVMETVAPAA